MHRRRSSLLALSCLVAVVGACDRQPAAKPGSSSVAKAGAAPRLSAAPADSSAVKAAEASLPSAGPPLRARHTSPVCTRLVEQQRELASNWSDRTYLPPALGQCYGTLGGAWAVVFDAVKVSTGAPGLTARVTVVHLNEYDHGDVESVTAAFEPSPLAGQLDAPSLPAGSNYALEIGSYYTDVLEPTLFDYDGDREPELLFTMQAYVSEGTASGSIGRVYTFKDGAVRRYARTPALRWSNIEDVDHDQRPDLVGRYLSIPVVAHSLPDGSFSSVDAAARAYAELACPRGRDAIFLPVPADAGISGATGWNGGCARLWGISAQAVIHEIDEHCAHHECVSKSARDDTVLESAEIFRHDARVVPPLILSKPRQ